MARPKSAPDFYLMGKVSAMYYQRDHTQAEIAERLGVSRPMVSRLLRESRAHGIVQITVTSPRGVHIDLESQLEDRFGLQAAQVVLSDPQEGDLLRRRMGAAAAMYLSRIIGPNDAIGMAWGTTLHAMVQAIAPMHMPGVRVVQTLGGVGRPDAEAYAADVVRRMAHQLRASAVLLPAPGIVATRAVRDVLRDDPHVQTALRELDTLDMVFVGLGALATNPVLNDGHSISRALRVELEAAGAIGDIALRFFDGRGVPIRSSLDERILGITSEQLRNVPRVVAVAGGREKIDAIFAALTAGLVSVLITDQDTAEQLVSRRA